MLRNQELSGSVSEFNTAGSQCIHTPLSKTCGQMFQSSELFWILGKRNTGDICMFVLHNTSGQSGQQSAITFLQRNGWNKIGL